VEGGVIIQTKHKDTQPKIIRKKYYKARIPNELQGEDIK